MSRHSTVLLGVLGIVLGGITLFWNIFYHTTDNVSGGIQDWSPLTMEYEITYRGDGGQRITRGYRHEYQNKYHWRNILLHDSEGPTFVGTASEYNGQERNAVELLINHWNRNTDVQPGSVDVPNEWLHPFYIRKLLAQSNTVSNVNGDIGTLVVTTSLPCGTPKAGMRAAGLGDCESERVETTEVTYRTADLIPLLIIESWDGIELRRITITKLTVNEIPQPLSY